MRSKYIATRLHQALELAPDDRDLQTMAGKPHYVIDRRLTEMFGREDVAKSITAIIEAGLARLPFPELVVEFDAEESVRRFVLLAETPDLTGFDASIATLSGPALTVTSTPTRVNIVQIPTPGFHVEHSQGSELDRLAAVFAAAVAMLMLNIQGIDKELIEPRALNAQRTAKGRPSVPRHTLLRIGTVVDSEGRSTRFSDGRHMPLHLRAGHVRHQAYGKGHLDRKLIYIPPVLVNFKPGDETRPVPQPRKILTR